MCPELLGISENSQTKREYWTSVRMKLPWVHGAVGSAMGRTVGFAALSLGLLLPLQRNGGRKENWPSSCLTMSKVRKKKEESYSVTLLLVTCMGFRDGKSTAVPHTPGTMRAVGGSVQEHSAWEQNREAAGCSQAKTSLSPHEKCQKQSDSDTQHSKTLKITHLGTKTTHIAFTSATLKEMGTKSYLAAETLRCKKAGQDPNTALQCTGITWELSRQCNLQHCSCSELGSTRPALSSAAITWGESQLRVLLGWRIPHPRSRTG